MQAPICQLCRAAHWPRNPHIWSKIPERATAVDTEPKPPEAPQVAAEGAGSSSEADPAERRSGSATTRPRPPGDTGTLGRAEDAGGSPALKFDKRAYQREYMRQRRAKQKAPE